MSDPGLDRELEDALDAARRGDQAGIGVLFRALQPKLLGYLDRRAPGEAEDLAAETWLAVARQLADFVGTVADLRALLFTVARRRTIDHYRAMGRRPRLVAIDVTGDHPAAIDVEEIALAGLSATRAIDAVVATLPPDQAEVVLLRVVAGLSAEEAGQVMGRSAGAVRVLQHRALKALAARLRTGDVTP